MPVPRAGRSRRPSAPASESLQQMSWLCTVASALSPATPRTTCSMSLTIDSKSAVASGWKTIAAAPRLVMFSPVCSVTYAVDIANSRSGAGPASLRRPVRTSRNPIQRRLWSQTRRHGRADCGDAPAARSRAGMDVHLGARSAASYGSSTPVTLVTSWLLGPSVRRLCARVAAAGTPGQRRVDEHLDERESPPAEYLRAIWSAPAAHRLTSVTPPRSRAVAGRARG